MDRDFILSIVGIILSVYFGLRVTHKKIRYCALRKKNRGTYSYVIALWNASVRTIDKQDVNYLWLHCDEDAKIKVVYSSDNESLLDIRSTPNLKQDYKLLFDFMLKEQGYLIRIDENIKVDKKNNKKRVEPVYFVGRLRAETTKSIEDSMKVNYRRVSILAGVGFLFFMGCNLWDLIIGTDILMSHLGMLFSDLCIVISSGYFLLKQFMPKKIRKEIHTYIKNGYIEIELNEINEQE